MDIRRAAIAAAGGAAVAALTLGAIPVGAQEPLLPISVTPTSGPVGTVFTASGADCIGEAGPGELEAYLWYADDPEPVLVWLGTVAADGTWTAPVQSEATDPPGTYTVSATCFAGPGSPDIVVDYDYVEFQLTAAPAPEAPADPAVEPAAAPVAAPAAAVPGRPSYAG
jgi:hypothetical protein